jgi:hypothetical protein
LLILVTGVIVFESHQVGVLELVETL